MSNHNILDTHAYDELSSGPQDESPDTNDVRFQVGHPISFTEMLIHLFKANIGIGVLNMPENMARAGVLLGPILGIVLLFPIVHCMLLLLKCSREVKKRYNKPVIGYAGTFRYAMLEHLGSRARYFVYIVNFFIITTQLGVCTVFIVFTSDTLQKVTEEYYSDTRVYMVIIGAILLPFVLVDRLDIMSVLSGAATIFNLFSLSCTLVYIFMNIKSPAIYPLVGDYTKLPLVISAIMYTFEGITIVVPLDNEMRDPKQYTLALKLATFGSVFLYLLVGWTGYLAYGSNVYCAVILNLPVKPFTNIVKVVYALGVLLTFFLQFHVAMSAVVPTLLKSVTSPSKIIFFKGLIRVLFTLLIVFFAVMVPQLNNVISLIGAFSGTLLGFVFPCVIHLAVFWNSTEDETRLTLFEITKDILIILLGVILCLVGGVTTAFQIKADYVKKP